MPDPILKKHPAPPPRRASLLTIFLIVFIDLMGFGIVLPNLQLYGHDFGIDNYFVLTLLGAVYSFFQFVFAPILGKWSDHIGRRPVLIISQAGTLVGFLLLYAAHFFEPGYGAAGGEAWVGVSLIFASRILDGISGGNISTASAYVADITPPEQRARGMGLIGAAFGIGFIFGPLIGGLVGGSRTLGLPYVPLVAAGFSLVALLLTIFTLPESLDPAHKPDPRELRRFSFGGLHQALTRPVIGPLIMMFFVNGFAFAGMEQTLSLLIQNRVFPTPDSSSSVTTPTSIKLNIDHLNIQETDLVVTTDASTSKPAAISPQPQITRLEGSIDIDGQQVPFGITNTPPERLVQTAEPEVLRMLVRTQDARASRATGYLFCGLGLIIALIQGGLIHRLTRRFGEPVLVITGPILVAAGLLVIGLPKETWNSAWTGFILGSALLAVGSSLFNPSLQALISRHASPAEQGLILGANQGMASLARALGPVLAGLLFQYVSPGSPYFVSAGLCAAVGVAALMMRRLLRPPMSS